jgi:hypothetical protein
MRRAVLFLSRFAFSVWIVVVIGFLSLLLSNAPSVPNTPFASLSIKAENSAAIHLPNRIFACTETGQQFQCETKIQNRLLNLSLTKGSDYKYSFSDCRALYDGRSVGCRNMGQTYAPILSEIYEITDLGLSTQQLQAVRQEYWGINTLMEWGELRLMRIGAGLSLSAGLGAAVFAWFYPGKFSKAFASLACGFGLYHWVWGLLGRVQYDVVAPYGFTPDRWDWVVNGSAIVAGVGTIFATALLLWQKFNRFTKIPMGLSSSVGVFNLCSLSLIWGFSPLLSLFGLAEPLLQDGAMLMWFSAVLSSIFAIIAAILLWLYTRQSIQKVLCLVSGIGAVALTTHFFMFVLLRLGYAD